MHIQNLVKFYPFVLKILSGKENLISIKGHNSLTKLLNMTGNYSIQDLVNINAHTKFGEILSICSQDIELKRISDINHCYNSVANLQNKRALGPWIAHLSPGALDGVLTSG